MKDLRRQQENDARNKMHPHEMLVKYLEHFCTQPCNETGEAFSAAYYYCCEPNTKLRFSGCSFHDKLREKACQYIFDNKITIDENSRINIALQFGYVQLQQKNDARKGMDPHEMLLKYLHRFCARPGNATGKAFQAAYYYCCAPHVATERRCKDPQLLQGKAFQYIKDHNIIVESKAIQAHNMVNPNHDRPSSNCHQCNIKVGGRG